MNNSRMDWLGRGFAAGFVATLALSVVIVIQLSLGLMPGLNLVLILAHAMGSQSAAVGWIAHYFVGVILWGALFAWVDRKMFFAHWINGLLFASVVWLGVMLVIMPIAGEGLFGLKLGIVTPTITLFLHWIYGVVLGVVYGSLQAGDWHLPHRLHHA